MLVLEPMRTDWSSDDKYFDTRGMVERLKQSRAQEAIWYDGDATDRWGDRDGYDKENDMDLIEYYLHYLDQYKTAGVPVFNCEYALGYAEDAYEKSFAKGYTPYCTRRSLGRLTTTAPPGY